ncbi:tRNA 2-thiocytidine biosynthesis TtcA family protein [Zongyangia hominis]|uniref:tRNA 2-thiocytidine(32) synthetase TtcA n=1 Tax=Zongyangia hominis TaxID=2763677 RepID=A0A926EEI5_9FIRM|nr:ATP-binding protein [Zongyangia hominis]MBC8570699.1 tRNA 2-thiocytidine(32) synthetase TtcA [Zongyangia hominis]
MQKMMGYMRKAITDYQMLQDGDRVAVGVSGGKDSVVLLTGLCRLRRFIGIDYQVVAVTLDPMFGGVPADYSAIETLCGELEAPFVLKRTDIGPVVFDIRKEPNPCSLCARMRRGALHDAAKEYGCNKIALGHHYDDAVETFLLNLFHEGRLGCFSPVSYLSRKDLTMIRPMIYAPERDVASAARRCQLPIVKSQCPADTFTQRQWAKDYLNELEKTHPGLKKRLFGAMVRGHISGW